MNDNNNEDNLIENNEINNLAINTSGRPTKVVQFGHNEENEGEEQIKEIIEDKDVKLSPYRFVIVILFFLLNFVNGMHWITFASCAAKFGKFYHLSNLGVDSLSIIFMFLYILTNFPCSWFIDKISMKWGLIISDVSIILGSIIKIFLNKGIAFAYIGQILTGLFQPAILNSPAKIAATWFNEKSRVIVTSICCLSNTIGIMFGFIIHTFNIDENTVNPKIFKRDFRTYIIVEAGITFIAGLLFIIFIREKPEHPPSLSKKSENRNQSFLEGIKKLKDDTNFIYLCISLSCIVGYVNMFATIFNSYMALYKISDMSASYISAISNIFGMLTAFIVAKIIDTYKIYKKAIIICNISALIFNFITMFLVECIKSKYLYIIAGIGYTLVIGSAIPIYTSGMDLVCEITYGIGESTSDGVIMLGNQLVGIIGIVISSLLRSYVKKIKWLTNAFGTLLFLISLFFLAKCKEDLKRTNTDRNKEQNIENEVKIKEKDN